MSGPRRQARPPLARRRVYCGLDGPACRSSSQNSVPTPTLHAAPLHRTGREGAPANFGTDSCRTGSPEAAWRKAGYPRNASDAAATGHLAQVEAASSSPKSCCLSSLAYKAGVTSLRGIAAALNGRGVRRPVADGRCGAKSNFDRRSRGSMDRNTATQAVLIWLAGRARGSKPLPSARCRKEARVAPLAGGRGGTGRLGGDGGGTFSIGQRQFAERRPFGSAHDASNRRQL